MCYIDKTGTKKNNGFEYKKSERRAQRTRCRNARLDAIYIRDIYYTRAVCLSALLYCIDWPAKSMDQKQRRKNCSRKTSERMNAKRKDFIFFRSCVRLSSLNRIYRLPVNILSRRPSHWSESMRHSDNNKRRELSRSTHTHTRRAGRVGREGRVTKKKNENQGSRRVRDMVHIPRPNQNRTHGAYSVLWL